VAKSVFEEQNEAMSAGVPDPDPGIFTFPPIQAILAAVYRNVNRNII
jgi:hypothetical protein